MKEGLAIAIDNNLKNDELAVIHFDFVLYFKSTH